MLPALVSLALAATGVPAAWSVVGVPVRMSDPALSWSEIMRQAWTVDDTGRYCFSERRQVDFRTGRVRGFGLYQARHTPYSKNGPHWDFRLCWEGQVPPGWCPYTFSSVEYAHLDTLGVTIPPDAIHGRRGAVYGGAIGGKARSELQALPTGIADRLESIREGLLGPSGGWHEGGVTVVCGKRLVLVRNPTIQRRIGEPKPVTNGVICGSRIAYLQQVYAGVRLAELTFRGTPRLLSLPNPPPVDSAAVRSFTALADLSIAGAAFSWGVQRLPDWMHRSCGMILFDPHSKRWSHFDGLLILGSSTDGRYVAYSQPPWKEMHLARVEG